MIRNHDSSDDERKVLPSAPFPVVAQPFKKPLSEFTYDNKFAYDFCSCCEDGKLCCIGTFCLPCLVFFQSMVWRLYIDAGEGCCAGCWQCFTFPIYYKCCCSNLAMLRTKIRGTYKIHGSIMEDIYYSACCPCCAAIQLNLELRTQGVYDHKVKEIKQ